MDRLRASRQSLEQAVRSQGLIPVLGPDALWVDVAGYKGQPPCTAPFYALVAEELLSVFGLDPAVSPLRDATAGWPLHQAVARVLLEQPRSSTERLRRSVATIVAELTPCVRAAPLLDRLAALPQLEMFVSLTPDDLLLQALTRVRGEAAVRASAYAPSSDSGKPCDLAATQPGGARVFHPLGQFSAGVRPAIHDEDALEYLFRFQQEAALRAPLLLETLRRRDLLLLGCRMPDWLGLGLIRMANEVRLSAQEKKMEFFAADAQAGDLADFLARFNPNATVFPWTPLEFVAEIEAIAAAGAGPGAAAIPAVTTGTPMVAAAAGAGAGSARATVFLSYASEDRVAVTRLADSLLTLGFDDVWLDQRQLRAGDDWSQRIDEAIEHCSFFMPVLSRQADARREGVFWEEWRKAMARALRVHDAFLLPVGIDTQPPAQAGYRRIFGGFGSELRGLHLVHAPAGALPLQAQGDLRQLAADVRGPGHG